MQVRGPERPGLYPRNERDYEMATAKSDEWTTVQDETPSRVIFDTIGDQFIGEYIGSSLIKINDGETFTQYRFRGTDGELYGINESYKIRQAMEDVEPGQVCRITYVKDVDTGQPAPMKDFRVDVRK
jgi:hypothetical protein